MVKNTIVMTPYIVAEASCNHLGSLRRAYALVLRAKECGADAIKFQCWHRDHMVLGSHTIAGSTWNGQDMQALYAEAWTPWEWFPALFELARRIGIDCFASVFDHESLAFLESLGCPRYKIASFEITDLPLIGAVAKTGKPIVLSTGMATHLEICAAISCALTGSNRDVTKLVCTSAYPATAADANLRRVAQWHAVGKDSIENPTYIKTGLSDHTLGLAVPVAATALGATMIEKHLTLSRADGGPDAGFSSEPHEFKAMVDACREAAAALGEVRYGPTEAELPSLQFRRSLYWAKDIVEGETITREHLRTARPALGLPPNAMYELIGTKAKHAAQRHTPVSE